MRPRREKSVFYPRTCDECDGNYKSQSTYSRHRINGTCARFRNFNTTNHIITNNISVQNNTTNNTNNEVTTSENEVKLKEECEKLRLELEELRTVTDRDTLPLLDDNCNYIYVVQRSHEMQMRLPIYKVGVTMEMERRHSQYPKGAKLLFCQVYPDARTKEQLLHKALRSGKCPAVKVRPDKGSEYYEGDVTVLIKYIQTFMDDQ